MQELTKEQWLEERRNHIGASDVAAILGVDPHRTALSVYESKINGQCQKDTDWLAYGRDIEGAIAKMYARKAKRKVVDLGATSFQYNPKYTWLAATLDRSTWFENADMGPLELKSIDPLCAGITANEYAEEPLLHHVIQLQIQMACSNATNGALAALFPGYNLVHKDFEYSEDFINAALPKLEEFWERVQVKNPPPPETHRDLDVVKRLYPAESGRTIELDKQTVEIINLWEHAKKEKLAFDKLANGYEAKIRSAMQDASVGLLGDGTQISLRSMKRKGYTRTVEPCEFRVLRRSKVK
jgi:putative phage-type endonuclease